MVITFSNIKGSGGGGGATGGTVSGITLWSSDYTQEYIDNALSGVTDALSAYTPTSGFSTINGSAITTGDNLVIEGTPYSAGTNIDITDHIISVTGITIPTSNTAFTNDAGYITSGEAQTQIDDSISGKADTSAFTAYYTSAETDTAISNAVSGKMDTSAMSAYTPTSGFSTINGSAITEGGNITVEETPYSAGTGIGISEHVISVTGDYETVVELTQAEYDALTAYSENTTYIITDAPAINMSAYTPTSGFSTINGSAITTGEAIVIEETEYSAGTNIDITNNVISVTGITVPTKLSDLTNDEGFITSADTQDFVTSGDVKTQIEGYGYITEDALSGLASETYVDNAVSGKADTSALTQYYTSAQTENAISGAISSLKEEIEGEIPTKVSDLQNDLNFVNSGDVQTQIDNSISGKADTSRVDEIEEVAASALTNLNSRVDELSGNSVTTGTVQSMITAATEGLASTTYVDNSVSGKADSSAVTADIAAATAATTGWVENQGYLTTETDPIFTGSPAYGITSEDITNWNSVSGKQDTSAMTAYYTSGETNTAISNATSGLASTTYVDNSVSGKMDTSAMTAYATTGWVNEQGFLTAFTETDPIFTGSPAYGITAQDIANWNAATGGSAYSAGQYINIDVNNEISVTGITSYTGITSGDVVTALGYTPISGVDLSDYYTSAQTDTAISDATSGKVDTTALTAYYTSAQTDTAISNAVSGKADSSRVDEVEEVAASALTDLNNRMITTGTVESMITAATSGKQDTLVSGTNIKTINNESILGSGNITIQGGGGANIIELTQAEYDALTAYTEDAIYVITDAPVYDISNYELLSNKVTSISSASTNTQYPSAKCVYDLIGDVETLLANI